MFLYLPPILSLWRGKEPALGDSSSEQFLSSRNVLVFQVLGQESNGLQVPSAVVGGSHWAAFCLEEARRVVWFASLSG